MGRSVNPGMARRAQDGRCGPPGRSGCRPALPPVGRAGPAADVPAGSGQTAADHTPGIGWSAASCRSIRHRLLGIGSSPGSHESGAVTARLTMVQLVLQGVIFNHRTVSAGHGRSRIVWRAELTAPRAGAIGSVLAGTPRRRRAPDNWAAKRCTRDSLDSGTAHGSDSTKPISRNIE